MKRFMERDATIERKNSGYIVNEIEKGTVEWELHADYQRHKTVLLNTVSEEPVQPMGTRLKGTVGSAF